ncbi:MAG TPA: alpha/beta hydrolase family protein [Bryobacteraceae bacterium]|nr:alpha/beta hydrolase family protein [Bryobacteraceae bacterium]
MSQSISRRELGLAAAFSVSAAAGQSAKPSEPPKKYGGALQNDAAKVNMSEFDPVAWTLERYKSAPLRLTFRASTPAEAEAWQKELRAKVTELLGGFPDRTPLHFESLETREFPGYMREKFVFESRPGVGVLAYLLTPNDVPRPLPAVVCIPGHGRGVDDIVGIDEYGHDRTDKPGYQHDFAIQTAEHGMAALAIEPMAFGCRRDALTASKGLEQTACQPSAGAALLLGETMIGWRVWDVMRAIDWIETRPELDPKRVGCMGISGGGTATCFAAALDTRIRAAVISGYLNTFRDSIMSLSHCMDNYVPGILNWAEQYDVAGLIAPRPLFSEGGEQDPIFPVKATRESFQRVRRVYTVFGAPDKVQQDIFPGEHVFNGRRSLPFLKQALS